MAVPVHTEERLLEEILTLLHVPEEPIDIVRQRILVPADEDIKGFHGTRLKLRHQVFVAHLAEGLVVAVARVLGADRRLAHSHGRSGGFNLLTLERIGHVFVYLSRRNCTASFCQGVNQ